MKIEFNIETTVCEEAIQENHFNTLIIDGLKKFESHITRIEVHLVAIKGATEDVTNLLCILEARLRNRQPMAISFQADLSKKAVSGAIEKLNSSLNSIIGRMHNSEIKEKLLINI